VQCLWLAVRALWYRWTVPGEIPVADVDAEDAGQW
jgi:hypothetical protein